MRLSRKRARELGLSVPPNGHPKPPVDRKARERLFDQMCRAHQLPAPVHEYQWHPTRKFRADWCFAGWVLVEQDGGVYGRGKACPSCGRRPVGAHGSIRQQRIDREKDREAILYGFVTLRFLPEEFENGSAFAFIKLVLEGQEEMA